jgi:hypothetical protein
VNFNTRIASLVIILAASLGCDQTGRVMPTAPSPTSAQPTLAPSETGPRLTAIAGTVADVAWRPLAGARVEVVDGPHAGRSTTTNAQGDFFLSGIFDDTTHFRASKEGHVADTRPLNAFCVACNPNWWVHFYLESLATSVNLAGDYTLTFIPDSRCASLPEEVRTRSYDATVTQRSGPGGPVKSFFYVSLTGAKFLERHGSFDMGLADNYLRAELGDGHGEPGLMEEVAANTYLTFGGRLEATVTDASTIAGSLVGDVDFCTFASASVIRNRCHATVAVIHTHCPSQNHRVMMRRR